MQAAPPGRIGQGHGQAGPLKTDLLPADAGRIEPDETRREFVECYGGIDFLTPIAELPLAEGRRQRRRTVTSAGATVTSRTGASILIPSPRGFRGQLEPDRRRGDGDAADRADRNTRSSCGLSKGAAIAPGAGDPHPGALAHLALAINAESEMVKQGANFLGSMSPGLKANALGWLGQCVALYADEIRSGKSWPRRRTRTRSWTRNITELPVALYCEVKNPLGVTAFLTALRGFADQSAPGMAHVARTRITTARPT